MRPSMRAGAVLAGAAFGATLYPIVVPAQGPIPERPGEQTPLPEPAPESETAVLDEEDVEARVESLSEAVSRREEIVRMADQALERLEAEDPSAAELLDRAFGHAVFDTTKGGLIVTGAGGTGVARTAGSDEKTFMRVAAAGIGVGAGFENYKLVMAFEDAETYDEFVAGRWDGSLSAQAAAGGEGASAEERFIGGVRVYRLTDAGFIAQVDLSGMRFWPSEELNAPELE